MVPGKSTADILREQGVDPSWGIDDPGSINYNPNANTGWTSPYGSMSKYMQPSINKEAGEVANEGGKGDSVYQLGKVYGFGRAMDPMMGVPMWNKYINQDPYLAGARQQYGSALGQLGSAVGGYAGSANRYQQQSNRFLRGVMPSLRRQAFGKGPSLAEKYGAVQRQQAMGDIAKQAAMSSRGGVDLASRRSAIMGASNVGANMAAQIAAAKVQERQAAMQQFLQARQAQMAQRQSGLQAREGAMGARGRFADAQMANVGMQRDILGGAIGAGQQGYGATQTAMGNYFGG